MTDITTTPNTSRRTANARLEAELDPLRDDLYRFALHLTGNPCDADDVLQDAYLRATRSFARYKSGTNFKAWIRTLLRSAFIDSYRRAKHRPTNVEQETLEDTVAGDPGWREVEEYARSCDEGAFEDAFDDRIQSALASLPQDFRTAFLLAKVADFDYEYIAGIMKCPVGTVRSRLSRAKSLLRAQLTHYAA